MPQYTCRLKAISGVDKCIPMNTGKVERCPLFCSMMMLCANRKPEKLGEGQLNILCGVYVRMLITVRYGHTVVGGN
ncbi:hypothetical protein L596_015857 [Steinernema carpocapsae]|uniref:Uncharacterized protein n=1 Tax=Steinernema carpocapsae TaxID=34508 RepID=A0A4U5NH93_STECR|nr:hypothetical protein L596_015857 [Steinernema carpocapsae]